MGKKFLTIDGKNTKTFKISKGDSLESTFSDKRSFVEKLNKSAVVLSMVLNGK